MEYNGYYPAPSSGPPPLPPPPHTMMNQHQHHHHQHHQHHHHQQQQQHQHQHADCPPINTQIMSSMSNQSTIHSSPAPPLTPQSMRHTPGPSPMPPQQHMGPQTPTMPQQQQSPHFLHHQQMQPHPLPPHSASPHPSTPHQQPQPPPRPATGPSPMHHQQSPVHMNGPSPKVHPVNLPPPTHHHHNLQQPPNHMSPATAQPPHGPPSMLMQPHHNFMGPGPGPGGPVPPHLNPHYAQPPIQHHQGPPLPPPMHPVAHQHPGPIPVGHPPSGGHLPHHGFHVDRASPFNQHIPQTEFRIIELNKRLQCRPRQRVPTSPLPLIGSSEESNWWERFACEFFDEDSFLTLRVPGEEKPVEYRIGRTLIPRFFKSYFDGGAIDFSIKLRNNRETAHHNIITLDCDQADIITKNICRHPNANLSNSTVVVQTEGHLSLDFVSNSFDNLLIKSWRFYTHQCREYIDRSMTATGIPNTLLVEPVTRFGLTKSTILYLKMCMIMEPMQDLMLHHRQTKMDARACLKHLLYDKYKLKTIEDNRAQPNKRRRRKTPAAPGAAGTNKRSKANAININPMNNDSLGYNSNILPNDISGVTNLPLASQDVLVVGEPSMLGADFGDENERRITRLENSQFDISATDPSGGNSANGNASGNSNNNNNNISTSNNNNNNTLSVNNQVSQSLTQYTNNNHTSQASSQQNHLSQTVNSDSGGSHVSHNNVGHESENMSNNTNSNGGVDDDNAISASMDASIGFNDLNTGVQNNNGGQTLNRNDSTVTKDTNQISTNGANQIHLNHVTKPDMDLKPTIAQATTLNRESEAH